MKTEKIYSLPIRQEDFRSAISDPRAHKPGGKLEHAVDFDLPEGTPILAAADGTVKSTYTESSEGGVEDKFRQNINLYTNRICIQHANNEFSEYAHLKHDGTVVSVGDTVKRGDVIGYSGNTGLSTELHLHFHVMRIIQKDGQRDWETLDIMWDKQFDILGKTKNLAGCLLKFFLLFKSKDF